MLKIAICDDEKEELEKTVSLLAEILKEEDREYDLATYHSPSEMMEDGKEADIALLDVVMGSVNGIELGRKLKQRFPDIKVIYTTSFEQYCMQAINEIHAYSFLCKPLKKEELKPQLLELIEAVSSLNDLKEIEFNNILTDDGTELSFFSLKLKDIFYFESIKTDRKVSVVHTDGVFTCALVIDKLAKELKEEGFAVNCRGQLVNLRHVTKLKGYDLYLDNGKTLPLSQKRVAEFKKLMNDFLHGNIKR
ncbi:MAG: response regulator transcription factor [Lachnospiraceae bacterium]|nr:response regulator transcription factor [Lachnospiraceae bacterium]